MLASYMKLNNSFLQHIFVFWYLVQEKGNRNRINESRSENFAISSGVPQGNVIGPLLYVLYTADLPTTTDITIDTFADGTVILAAIENPIEASNSLETHLDQKKPVQTSGRLN